MKHDEPGCDHVTASLVRPRSEPLVEYVPRAEGRGSEYRAGCPEGEPPTTADARGEQHDTDPYAQQRPVVRKSLCHGEDEREVQPGRNRDGPAELGKSSPATGRTQRPVFSDSGNVLLQSASG